MRYLLDTNVCIEILRGRNLLLRSALATRSLDELALCSVVRAELYCGARLSRDPVRELEKLQAAFGHWPSLPFDDGAAASYGEIRAELQRAGGLIGGNDLMIAAIAKANGLTVVTHNLKDFNRIPGLPLEDWQSA